MPTQSHRILINTLPKSGTHLLSKSVEVWGYPEHFDTPDAQIETPIFLNYREAKNALAGHHARALTNERTIPVGTLVPFPVPLSIFRHWLDAIPQNRYILGHITWTPDLAPLLAELEIAHIAIIRDPRAVIASLLAFILDTRGMPKPHFLEADFKYRSKRERLDLLLHGGYAPEARIEIQDFATVYRAMLAWQKEPNSLLLRFEDLIGSQGGGSDDRQQATMIQIAQHLGCEIPASIPSVFNSTARTFRQGKIDSWKDNFETADLKYLLNYCEPLCLEAGYAK